MPYGQQLLTAPTSEPLTLAEAKSVLNIDQDVTEWDAEISGVWIPAAREYIEKSLSIALVAQTWLLTFDQFPRMTRPDVRQAEAYIAGVLQGYGVLELPLAGTTGASSVKYYDTSNVLQTLSAGNYQVDTTQALVRLLPVVGQYWPATYARLSAVEVRVTAGQLINAVTPTLRAALRMILKDLYEGNEESGATKILMNLAWDGKRHGPQLVGGPHYAGETC